MNVILFLSLLLHTPGYTEGCTCLMTICATQLWKIVLRVEYNKGGDKQSLAEVCTFQYTKNKLPWESLYYRKMYRAELGIS